MVKTILQIVSPSHYIEASYFWWCENILIQELLEQLLISIHYSHAWSSCSRGRFVLVPWLSYSLARNLCGYRSDCWGSLPCCSRFFRIWLLWWRRARATLCSLLEGYWWAKQVPALPMLSVMPFLHLFKLIFNGMRLLAQVVPEVTEAHVYQLLLNFCWHSRVSTLHLMKPVTHSFSCFLVLISSGTSTVFGCYRIVWVSN